MRYKKGEIPWNKGKKTGSLSEEHKRKISNSLKGRTSPMKGKKHSEEAIMKISENNKGENNPNWGKRGEECSWYGRKMGEEELEMRRNMVLGNKNPMYGKTPWNKGLTKEDHPSILSASNKLKGREITWRDKLSDARKGKYGGENHPNWKGGLKDNPYGVEFDEKLREKIRERDGRKCVLCEGLDTDRKLQTHHIDYDKTNNDPMNLVSLCLRCHIKTNYNRKYWTLFFSDFLWFLYTPQALYTSEVS